jgi:hypothetical protein
MANERVVDLRLARCDVQIVLHVLIGRWRQNMHKLNDGGSAYSCKIWANEAEELRGVISSVYRQTGEMPPGIYPTEVQQLGLTPPG